MTLDDWSTRLDAHFAALHGRRPEGRPVFALEHGLSTDEADHFARAVQARIRSGTLTLDDCLPVAVYAAELGYRFDGLEYWGSFADRTPGWTDLWTVDRRRRWVRSALRTFATKYGGAEPSGAWARKFGIIAWPITHAILPLDLQRHLVRILGQRLNLRAHDLADPVRLGERIQAEASHASKRFQVFAQQTALVGQIALAILEDDDQAAAYLDPSTVGRFVHDIQQRRADGAFLDAARQSARVHLRGMRSGATGTRRSAVRVPGDPTPRSLGLAVDLDVRPREDGTWTVGLTLPGLHPLASHTPSFRMPLETAYLSVNGSDDVIPPATLLYGRRRVVLDRWPDPNQPLLDLDDDAPRLKGLLAELSLGGGDIWLFRILADGTSREVAGRHVRPGETYVLLRPGDAVPPVHDGQPLRLACEGVQAVQFAVPDAPDADYRAALSAVGVNVASALTVWPAGVVPASDDGSGSVEWLVGDPAVVGLSSDASVVELSLALDGGPSWSLGTLDPGGSAFVSLGELAPGTHALRAEALIDDGADGSVAEGELHVRVRERSPWSAGESLAAPLHVRVTPPQPDLDELWTGGVSVEAWGPHAAPLRLCVDFLESTDAPPFEETSLPSLRLPVTERAWEDHLTKHLLSKEKLTALAERAGLVRLHLDAGPIGATTLDAHRHHRPLRWLVDGQAVRLLDDRGAEDPPEVLHVNPRVPLDLQPLDAETALRGLTLADGGLVVARGDGEEVSALVVPAIDPADRFAALRVLTPDCNFGDVRRTPADFRRVLEGVARWGEAGSLAGRHLRHHILRTAACEIGTVLAGPNWARDERTATEALASGGPRARLDELRLRVPPNDERGDWQRLLARVAEADTLADRVQAFETLCVTLYWLNSRPRSNGTDGRALRRALGPEHPGWVAEFALRLASAPHTLVSWSGDHLDAALHLVIDAPQVFRAARYAVIASSNSDDASGPALYPTWTWPSRD